MLPLRPSSLCLAGSLTLAASLLPGAVWAQAGDVHQHGVAHLDLAIQGQNLELQIRSPGMDLLGFEHEPRDDVERQAVDRLRRSLVENTGLVVPTAAAVCTLVSAEARQDDHDDDHGHGHGHDHGHDHAPDHRQQSKDNHAHGHSHDLAKSPNKTSGHDEAHAHAHDHAESHGHGDWLVSYRYECRQPSELRGVSLGWFKAFPSASEIHFQAVTPAGQTGGTLTPQQAEIRW